MSNIQIGDTVMVLPKTKCCGHPVPMPFGPIFKVTFGEPAGNYEWACKWCGTPWPAHMRFGRDAHNCYNEKQLQKIPPIEELDKMEEYKGVKVREPVYIRR